MSENTRFAGSETTLSIDGPRATIRLNRPDKHNSLTLDDMRAVARAVEIVDRDDGVRALVLTGAGEKTFCAGASLGDVADGDWSDNPFEQMTATLESARVPTICAMNGSVYGGGVEVALCCDFRIGVEGMRMFVPPARLGIHYPLLGLRRFVERLGLGPAKRILLAVETFEGAALKDIGFVDRLVPRAELGETADALVDQIAALAPLSVQGMKRTLNAIARDSVSTTEVDEWIARCGRSEDHREALAALSEKRAARFKGR